VGGARETVRMTLDGQLADRTTRAQSQAALYRELLDYPMTPELRQHVTTRLTQLQQIDPSISLKPLRDIRLGPTSGQARRRRSRRARSAIWPPASATKKNRRRDLGGDDVHWHRIALACVICVIAAAARSFGGGPYLSDRQLHSLPSADSSSLSDGALPGGKETLPF
jgi:hypothetical protein